LQLQLMAHVSRWLAAQGRDARALGGGTVEAFLVARRAAGYTRFVTDRAMAPMLGYLRAVGAAPAAVASAPGTPVELLLERYRRYLLVERGLAARTARGYVDAVRPFLDAREAAGGLRLERLSAAEVTAFVVARCPGQARGSAKLTVTAMRSLLGFLHVAGMIGRPLAGAVPSAASWRLAGLPRALEPWQVRRLLGSCDRRTATGRRDFAMLLVLARLGLRAGEVAALRLEDVDWRAGEIVVRGKGRRSERLPLPADVGEPVAAYLRRGRPASAQDGSVFVRVKAPHRALTTGGVTQVVVSAARRARLGQIHAHRLRHSAATAMLRAGAPLEEIGQVLRHRAPLTTAIYAKVDRNALRQLARPWPEVRS
jgi:site-specific recombinase XerD